ncbi:MULTISPECIES: hydroxyisourate hydrolase [Bacteria]|uniref:hydroxyisourate hydrolase n=1 Tax=Bacteria TaxID=2 RepID=UPI001E5E54A8|nr:MULTISPECIES: hydroxyisourate hydrolase [Bacillaceae]MCE4047815.1 hydroxyisourate hydrolase [Bacillus sp. Au-Bac7]MCM3031260.1 hydroxyisourate hydrolase [Niallia sp. MER 6]
MKTGITTHVLDLVKGVPASNILVELWKYSGANQSELISSGYTNDDGRVETPLLTELVHGEYELVFYVEDYFKNGEMQNVFFRRIPIRFLVAEGESHYHVPLLLSAWGYQTYRGS